MCRRLAVIAFCTTALSICHGFQVIQQCSLPPTNVRRFNLHSYDCQLPTCNDISIIASSHHKKTTLLLSKLDDESSFSSNIDDDDTTTTSVLPSLWLFGGIPLLSIILPVLLQLKLIAPLVIYKRIYIYTLAVSVLVIGSIRGSSDSPSLGTRLIDLTRDILPYDDSVDSSEGTKQKQQQKKDDTRFQEMSVLDNVEDSTQAVGLPLLVSSSLVASLFFVKLLQNTEPPESAVEGVVSIQSILPQMLTVSNAAVISLFARAELLRLFPDNNNDDDEMGESSNSNNDNDIIATVGALALSGLAFLGPPAYVWPIQNILCACLAISVARAIQIPKFIPIVLALSALVVYDVVSVGIQLVNLGAASMAVADQTAQQHVVMSAATSSTTTSTAANSAMGAVALAKTTGSNWQPGLFEIRLRGITTDLLGLGDSVFPSLLSTFCLRFDNKMGELLDDDEKNLPVYFIASIVGFVIGCSACELVPGISDTGLPALLFLVPSMLTIVLGLATIRGELSSFVEFDPAGKAKDVGE